MQEPVSESTIDRLYEKGKEFIVREQAVSVSLLQVHLRIKYEIALGIVSRLETNGVVKPLSDTGLRQLTDLYIAKK